MNVGLLTKKNPKETKKKPVKNIPATLKHFLITKMVQLVPELLSPLKNL